MEFVARPYSEHCCLICILYFLCCEKLSKLLLWYFNFCRMSHLKVVKFCSVLLRFMWNGLILIVGVEVWWLFWILKFHKDDVEICTTYTDSFLGNLSVTKFRKSIDICQNYDQKLSILFFETWYILHCWRITKEEEWDGVDCWRTHTTKAAHINTAVCCFFLSHLWVKLECIA